jgi:hypothetical protein
LKKKNIVYEDRICELQHKEENYKVTLNTQQKELVRLNGLINLKQKGTINMLSKLQKFETFKKSIFNFVDTDDCILVNGVVQNTPALDCDWFQSSMFDKKKYILLLVTYFKQKLNKVIKQSGIK